MMGRVCPMLIHRLLLVCLLGFAFEDICYSQIESEPDPKEILHDSEIFLRGQKSIDVRTFLAADDPSLTAPTQSEFATRFRFAAPNRIGIQMLTPGFYSIYNDDLEKTLLSDLQRYLKGKPWKSLKDAEFGLLFLPVLGPLRNFAREAIYPNKKTAVYLGMETIDGLNCYRIRCIDDEMQTSEYWIQTGSEPLLRKAVQEFKHVFQNSAINYTETHTTRFKDWNFDPQNAEAFRFHPTPEHREANNFDEAFGIDERPSPESLIGKQAPEFQLNTLMGEKIDLKDSLGRKTIVLEFTASWCVPCTDAVKALSALSQKYDQDSVAFYAVNAREKRGQIKKYYSDMNLKIPVLLDDKGKVFESYRVDSIPHTVLIGKDGTIHAVELGHDSEFTRKLSQEIDRLIQGKRLVD